MGLPVFVLEDRDREITNGLAAKIEFGMELFGFGGSTVQIQ
jgi:hypothetical protein